MSWFGVKITLRAIHINPSDDLYDEMVIVVMASNEDQAFEKAAQIAEGETTQYLNVYGELVSRACVKTVPTGT